jgi:integrase
MKKPNSYGGITKMKGNRRRPFRVRITTGWEYNAETGKQKQKFATLGYCATRKEAEIMLARYNESPYDLDKSKITFEEVYNKWSEGAFKKMIPVTAGTYKSAYKLLEPLHKRKMRDLKKNELQAVMDSYSEYSESAQTKIKSVIRAVFRYCMENDLVEKDYSQFVSINKKPSEQIHATYTSEEIQRLWDNLDLEITGQSVPTIKPVDLILISIYTGMRPGEVLALEKEKINLEDHYMIGGFKTDAGTDRVIPIHDAIFPLVKNRLENPDKWFVTYKGKRMSADRFRRQAFDKVMSALNMNHLPHDGRHTFATFAARSELKDHMVKLIMGHQTGDLTKDVYTHVTPEELLREINKINFI